MENVSNALKRACDKLGFKRVRYQEKNIPTSLSNISVMLHFGDMRSTFCLSSFLLKRYREEAKSSKYFILASWKGYEGLFPYVDEYWELNDYDLNKSLYNRSNLFVNYSDHFKGYQQILNGYFEDVLDYSDLKPYYNNGFTTEFFERFKHIKRFLPSVPSTMILGNEFNRRLMQFNGNKIFIYPTMYIQGWKNGTVEYHLVPKSFWNGLLDWLLSKNYCCIVYKNQYTHDLSQDYLDRCVFVQDDNILNVMAAMRSAVVLDVFSGISKLAITARTPYLQVQDRNFYNFIKEYEIDDLAGYDVPREYVFSFPSISDEVNQSFWASSLFSVITAKLERLLNNLVDRELPSPNEINEPVLYSWVREIRSKKLGTKFIKVPKY